VERELNYQRVQISGKRQFGTWAVPSAYRLLAFAIATAQIFAFPSAQYSISPPLVLVIGVGIYSVAKAFHPLRWHQAGFLGYSLFGADIAICALLVLMTGGIYSPFLLYTLTPVLTAALLLGRAITFGIGGLSAVYVLGVHLGNPFFSTRLSIPELSYFLVYVIAVCLTATLPYLINANLRERLQSEDILQERQRLSRELHDGVVQTLSALRWQGQLLHRRLAEMGIDLDEVRELERLLEKGHQEARESLELLRNYTGDGRFLPHFKDYLEHLSQSSGIGFRLDAETSELHLGALAELELLRICQEAVTNVRKHSGAHEVQVKVELVNGHLKVSITDDGCGFDALAYYHDGTEAKGHGLAVMQERAESIGGRVRVLSMPGQGTEVQVEVPTNSHQGRLPWLNK